MPAQRKLGRPTDQRRAMLKGLVTSLLHKGRIETTQARAKEVKNIAEKLIAMAIKEIDNTESKQVKVSAVKLDAKGNKVTNSVTSKNGNKYLVVEREVKTDMVAIDKPSRLHARKKAINWIYKIKNEDGMAINVANKLFGEIAEKYKDTNGGYTRMYKLGPRKGDAAEMVVLELK